MITTTPTETSEGGLLHMRFAGKHGTGQSDARSSREALLYGLSWAALCACAVCTFVYLYTHLPAYITSDDSAEMILARQLVDEGGILSKDWYYSTELRFLNLQLVYMPFFLIFKSWSAVRLAATVVWWVILLLSLYYLCSELDIRMWFPAIGCLFFLPAFTDSFTYLVTKLFYLPHLCITLVSVGLLLSFVKTSEKEESPAKDKGLAKGRSLAIGNSLAIKNPGLLLPALFLALAAGLGGQRQILVLYLPLFLAMAVLAVLDAHSKKLLGDLDVSRLVKFSGLMLISATAGALVNQKVLHGIYHFASFQVLKYRPLDFGRLQTVLAGWMTVYGYRAGKELVSVGVFYLCLFVLLFGLIVLALADISHHPDDYSAQQVILSVFFVSAATVITLLYCFSDAPSAPRYLLPISTLAFPLIAVFLSRSHTLFEKERIFVVVSVAMLLVVTSYSAGRAAWRGNNLQKSDAASAALEAGYTQGYGSFWNADVLTELTDGCLEMWGLPDTRFDGVNDFSVFQWLQNVEHGSHTPDGPLFVIVSRSELSSASAQPKVVNPAFDNLGRDKVFYENDEYLLYGYQSFEELEADAKE